MTLFEQVAGCHTRCLDACAKAPRSYHRRFSTYTVSAGTADSPARFAFAQLSSSRCHIQMNEYVTEALIRVQCASVFFEIRPVRQHAALNITHRVNKDMSSCNCVSLHRAMLIVMLAWPYRQPTAEAFPSISLKSVLSVSMRWSRVFIPSAQDLERRCLIALYLLSAAVQPRTPTRRHEIPFPG